MFDDFTMPTVPDGWDFTTGLRRYLIVGERRLVNSWTMAREQAYDGDFKLLRDVWGTVYSRDPYTVHEARSFHDALGRMKADRSQFIAAVEESPVDLARAVARAFDLKVVVSHLYRSDREKSADDENATLHDSGSDDDEERAEFYRGFAEYHARVLAEHGRIWVCDGKLTFRTYVPTSIRGQQEKRAGYWEHEFSLSGRNEPVSRFVIDRIEL